MNYRKRKDEIWLKATAIPGKNPALHRMDRYGNEIYYYCYGKNTKKGWEIDHGKPVSKNGTHHLNNLHPVHTQANRQKSNRYPYKHRINCKTECESSNSGWGAFAFTTIAFLILVNR